MSSKYTKFYCPVCLVDAHLIPIPYSADVGRRFSAVSEETCVRCSTDTHAIPIPYSADVGRRFSAVSEEKCILCVADPHAIPVPYSADVGRRFSDVREDACEICKTDSHLIPIPYSADVGRRFFETFAQNCRDEFKVFESTINQLQINVQVKQNKSNLAVFNDDNSGVCYNSVPATLDHDTELIADSPINIRKTFVTTKLLPMLSTYAFKTFEEKFTYVINQGEKNIHATNDGEKLTPFMQPWDRLTPLAENLSTNRYLNAYVINSSPYVSFAYNLTEAEAALDRILSKYRTGLKNIYLSGADLSAFPAFRYRKPEYDATTNYNFTYTISGEPYNLASFLYLGGIREIKTQDSDKLKYYESGINPPDSTQCMQKAGDSSYCAKAFCCAYSPNSWNFFENITNAISQECASFSQPYEIVRGFHYVSRPNEYAGWAHPQNNTNAAIQFRLSSTTGYNNDYYGPSGTNIDVLVPVFYDPENTTNYKLDILPEIKFEVFQLQCVRESDEPDLNPNFNSTDGYNYALEIMRTQCKQNGKYYFWSKYLEFANLVVYNFPLLYSEYVTTDSNNAATTARVVPTSWYDCVRGDKCVKTSKMNVTRISKMDIPEGYTYPLKLIYYVNTDSETPEETIPLYVSDAGDDSSGILTVNNSNIYNLWDSYDTLTYHTMTQAKQIVKDTNRSDLLYDNTDVLTISSLPNINNTIT